MRFSFKTLFAVSALLSGVSAWAWNTNVSENTLVCPKGAESHDLAQCVAAPQGGVYVSWISWDLDKSFAYLKLQYYDAAGRNVFPDGGIYVCREPTPTWSSGYDLDVTPDGNALLVYNDKRNGVWQAYAYCIDPTGESVWKEEGVSFNVAEDDTCFNPKLCVTNSGNVVVGFQTIVGSRSDIKIFKLKADGSSAWGGNITVPALNFALVPTGEDGFFVGYYDNVTGNLVSSKYTANGEEAWEEPVVIGNSGNVQITAEPTFISDGQGGVLAGWREAPNAMRTIGMAQRMDSDGNLMWGLSGVELSDIPDFLAAADGGYYMACRNNEVAPDVACHKISAAGEIEWSIDRTVNDEHGLQYTIYGLVDMDDSVGVVYREQTGVKSALIKYARISHGGQLSNGNCIVSDASGDKGYGEVAWHPGEFVAAWTDNDGNVYGQNVRWAVSSIGSIQQGDDRQVQEFYDLGGRRITGNPAKGIYIVKEPGGTRKVMVR